MTPEFGQFLDKLLSATNIVDVIRDRLLLTRKGGSWWACCPFHHEKTASFSVNEANQYFHCFGCGESGNAFKFLQKYENIEFMGAVQILADRAHMEVPSRRDGDRDDKAIAAAKDRRDAILKANKDAAGAYYHLLMDNKSNPAYTYLKNRQLSDEILTRFGLGYAPDRDTVPRILRAKGHSSEVLREAGLVVVSDRGEYDPFFGRMIVPIISQLGEVIAFGGRVLEKTDFAKYRNSINNAVFDKSKTLFGANLVSRLKKTRRLDYVILCEGYIDVISLHMAGFCNALASMGTSLTIQQARGIKRLADTVVVSYDGDAAGQKATLRSFDILEDAGLVVRVVSLPDGLDPDDIVNKQGKDAYQRLLDEALPLVEFKLKACETGLDLATPAGRHTYAKNAVDVVATLPNRVMQEEYLRHIAKISTYSVDVLTQQLAQSAGAETRRAALPPPSAPEEAKTAEYTRFLLARLLYTGQKSALLPHFLQKESHDAIYSAALANPGVSVARLETRIDERYLEAFHAVTGAWYVVDESKREAHAAACEKELALKKLTDELAEATRQYDTANGADGKRAALLHIQELQTELQKKKTQ